MMAQHLHRLHFFAAPASPAALICVCTLLAGCGTAPPATVHVDVPVFVPCVTTTPARPVFEFDKLGPAVSAGEKVLALARDWPRGRKYEGELEAVIAGCR